MILQLREFFSPFYPSLLLLQNLPGIPAETPTPLSFLNLTSVHFLPIKKKNQHPLQQGCLETSF